MLSRTGRPLARILFGPVARIFVRIGISANTVTVLGTLLTVVAVLTFFPLGYLRTGTVVAAVLVIFDNLDGQIARSTHTDSKWGAFLDSTMDRIADAAVNAGILIWAYLWADAGCRVWILGGTLAALIFGSVVPYARARAEAVGMNAAIGIAERADRLAFTGICVFLVGCGLSEWILAVGMWILAFLAAITSAQRIYTVYRQCASLRQVSR